MSLDEVMLCVLDVVLAHDGKMSAEPGELLKQITVECSGDYYAVAAAVRRLETLGWLAVERLHAPESHKANKVISVEIAD